MSEAKFTKGPWVVNNTGPHWNNQETDCIEINYGSDTECVVDHVYEIADANLIAAAPDMYNMLNSLSDYSTFQGVPAWVHDIKLLLAKARGE